MPSTNIGIVYVKDKNGNYKPVKVEQKITLIPKHTNTKKSSKGGKGTKGGKSKKRRTYKKKRYLKR
jgi:hypothetical protein